MATVLQDTFTDSSGTGLPAHPMDVGPSGPNTTGWTAGYGAYIISTNFCVHNVAGPATPGFDPVFVESGVSDCVVACDMLQVVEGVWCGLVFRLVDKDNYWMVLVYHDATPQTLFNLYEVVAQSFTLRAAGTAPGFVNGVATRLTATLSGTSISISEFLSGNTISYSSSLFQTATKHGIAASDGGTGQIYDNFFVTTDDTIPPQTGSGGMVLDGSASVVFMLAFAPTAGNAVCGGSATASQATASYTVAASGGMVLSNAAILLPTYIYQPTSNAVFSGNVSVATTFAYTAAGNIVFGGSASAAPTLAYTTTSNAVFSSSASVASTFAYTATSNAVLSGSASVVNSLLYSSKGNVVISGAVDIVTNYIYIASLGNIVLGESATASPTSGVFNYNTVTGNIVLSGIADARSYISLYTATGNIVTGNNSSPINFSSPFLAAGNIIFSETAAVIPTYIYTSFGGNAIFAGTAVTNNAYIASGGINLGNNAATIVFCSYVSSGNIVVSASASVLVPSSDYSPTGNMVFGGSTTSAKLAYAYTASGNLVVNNAATAKIIFTFLPSGNLQTSSSAIIAPIHLVYFPSSVGYVLVGGTALYPAVSVIEVVATLTVTGSNTNKTTVTVQSICTITADGTITSGSVIDDVRHFINAPPTYYNDGSHRQRAALVPPATYRTWQKRLKDSNQKTGLKKSVSLTPVIIPAPQHVFPHPTPDRFRHR